MTFPGRTMSIQRLDPASRLNLAAWVVFLAVWIYRAMLVLFSSPRHLVSLMPDDSSYYFLVAHHVASGVGSTFDGVNMTNGYHPLWMMICTLFAWMTGGGGLGDPTAMAFYARVVLMVQMTLGLLAVLLVWIAMRRLPGMPSHAPAMVPLVFALPWQIYAMTDGLESALTLLFWAGLFYFLPRLKPFTSRPGGDDFAFGALLSIGFLARLDHALLCLAIAMVAICLQLLGKFPPPDDGSKTRSWTSLLLKTSLWAAPVAFTAALYFFINQLYFDSITPISGKLKNTFPDVGFNPGWLRQFPVSFLFGIAVVLGPLLITRLKWFPIEHRCLMICATVFVLIHGLNTLLFTHWAVHVWHFTGWYIPFAVVTVVVMASLPRWVLGEHVLCVLVFMIVVVNAAFLKGREDRAFQARSHDAALWARENISDGRLIGMSDSGVFGAFRGGGVVNLDGVINNREYQDILLEAGLDFYLASLNIDFIAHHAVAVDAVREGYGKYPYSRRSHLHRKPGGTIHLEESQEIYRSEPFNDGRGERVFVIWRYQPESRYGRSVF